MSAVEIDTTVGKGFKVQARAVHIVGPEPDVGIFSPQFDVELFLNGSPAPEFVWNMVTPEDERRIGDELSKAL